MATAWDDAWQGYDPSRLGAAADQDINPPPDGEQGHSHAAPRVRLRSFAGDPAEYKEWRREVETATLLFNVPMKHLAGLI